MPNSFTRGKAGEGRGDFPTIMPIKGGRPPEKDDDETLFDDNFCAENDDDDGDKEGVKEGAKEGAKEGVIGVMGVLGRGVVDTVDTSEQPASESEKTRLGLLFIAATLLLLL